MFQFTQEKIKSLLTTEEYHDYFVKIVDKAIVKAPYDQEYYFSYTEANFKRSEKIKTQIELNKKLYNELNEGVEAWTWILITEPWCGDASFGQPIIEAICIAGNLDLKIALRDDEEELMNAFLSNGARSIPKLIVLDEALQVLFTWGPRPKELQAAIQDLIKSGGNNQDKLKLSHQWYRKYGNEAIQLELLDLIKQNKKGE